MDPHSEIRMFHKDPQLCTYLLGSIAASTPLQIRESAIFRAGSGLFALEAVPEGREIFRSTPAVECVVDGLAESVCDLCYTNTLSKVHPSGRFRTKDDAVPDMISCAECGKYYYCSKVSMIILVVASEVLHRRLANEHAGLVVPRPGLGGIS